MPPNLYSNDNKIASDHLPVLLVFANPFNTPSNLTATGAHLTLAVNAPDNARFFRIRRAP